MKKWVRRIVNMLLFTTTVTISINFLISSGAIHNGEATAPSSPQENIALKAAVTPSSVVDSIAAGKIIENGEAKVFSPTEEITASKAPATVADRTCKTSQSGSTKAPSPRKGTVPTVLVVPTRTPILIDSFEKGLGGKWNREMANDTYSGMPSSKYAQAGTHAYRFELRLTDPLVMDSKRSEIAMVDPEQPLESYITSFSVLLPDGGDEDYALDPKGSEIIAQWHNRPDPGEDWTTPPMALRTFNGRYVLERCWDDAPITSNDQMTEKGNRAKYDLGSYLEDKGKWVTWTFHISWGWLESQNPILEIYKNGTKILDLDGLPNTTNDQIGIRMKLGIYKWDWAQADNWSILTKRVIYFDNVSIR